ncbi:MAG: hypothetical protein ACJ75T_01720 [Solirubrobacterales bacterium]
MLILIALALGACGSSDESTGEAPRVDAHHPCRDMTPIEAARHYKGAARHAGASKRFLELVTEPTPAVESSPGYPRLVGAFYASTLPPKKRAAAAAACARELAAE